MDIIHFLVQASLALKENIFDRPDVKKFFGRRAKQLSLIAQDCIDRVVPKRKRPPSVSVSR